MLKLKQALKKTITAVPLMNKVLGRDYPYLLLRRRMKQLALNRYSSIPSDEIESLPMLDIAMLTLERLPETKLTIESIFRETKMKFNLIILDMNSQQDTKIFLQELQRERSNIHVIFWPENLGVSGGRAKVLEYCKAEFVAFLDNDMIIMPQYFERLVMALIDTPEIVAVQPKVVLPDGTTQINHPILDADEQMVRFTDADLGKRFDDESTLTPHLCDWTPMGATVWRREILNQNKIDVEMLGSFEDNEYTLRLHEAGYKFGTCPSALTLHIRAEFTPQAMKQSSYTQGRYNLDKTRAATKYFYTKHGRIIVFGDREGFAKSLSFKTFKEYELFIKGKE